MEVELSEEKSGKTINVHFNDQMYGVLDQWVRQASVNMRERSLAAAVRRYCQIGMDHERELLAQGAVSASEQRPSVQ